MVMGQYRIYLLRQINNTLRGCDFEYATPFGSVLQVLKHLVHSTTELKASESEAKNTYASVKDFAAVHSKLDAIAQRLDSMQFPHPIGSNEQGDDQRVQRAATHNLRVLTSQWEEFASLCPSATEPIALRHAATHQRKPGRLAKLII